MEDSRKDHEAAPVASGGAAAPGVRPRRGRGAADPISAGLKALWANVEKEPVPDEFLALLDRIDAARASSEEPGGGSGK